MQVLNIHVIPGSSRERIVEEDPTTFRVYVTQPAAKGKANKAMLHALAQYLHVRPGDLILSKGERFNEKTVLLMDDTMRDNTSSQD